MANQQGWNQQTSAVQHIIGKALGVVRTGTGRKRRASPMATGRKRKKYVHHRKGGKKKSARLVAGSAAAKAWGRKMKRLRKK